MATVAVEYGHDVSETDYGYGDQNMDYGYGDQNNSTEYKYGDSSNMDYGYGDSAPAEPAKEAPKARRPRRRCSVTKYSLQETAEKGSAEAEMVKNLHAAEMLQKFRQGL